MEGSTVRGQKRNALAHINEAQDLESFQTELVRVLSSEFKHAEISFGVLEGESNTLQLPAWIRSQLERQPSLHKKLEQGEMAGITIAEENAAPRPATAARSSLVLIPVIIDEQLSAAVALVSPLDRPQLSAEDLEFARNLAYGAAPILARIHELERLRGENQELAKEAARSARVENDLSAMIANNNDLHAILQMRSHQLVNVAHDLRTPMAAIRGYARMIMDGRAGEVNETQKEYLRVIADNTNRLITLVGWMGYVAELSVQHLKLTTFDFRDIWKACVSRSEPRLAEKGIKLAQQISDETFTIVGDREKLGDALNDLMIVAIRSAGSGETIAAQITRGREKELTFKLTHRSGAIPPDVLSKIFDRSFATLTKPMVQDTESGAINLSGVYDVVGMHGGRLFVNSPGGQGATFLFTLPAVTAGEEHSHEQAVNSGRRRR